MKHKPLNWFFLLAATSVCTGSLPAFTLELLHAADQEAAAAAVDDAPRFSAVLNALRAQDLGNDGLSDNTLTLSSGDAFIPGLFFDASGAVYGAGGVADIEIQNRLGFQAIAFGNHEFDFGTAVLTGLINGSASNAVIGGSPFAGTDFPYLSSNLGFGSDANMAPLAVSGAAGPQPNSVTSSVVLDVNGEKVGVVGATTPTLRTISSPGNVTVNPNPFGGVPTPAQLDALAAEIQAAVDALLAANPGMNKVVLLAHMQQIAIEQALAGRLRDVDIIVAGGSNTRLLDENDRPRPGDNVQGTYPIWKTDLDGYDVPIVNTDGSYKYVGRLVIDFDANGRVIKNSYDSIVSGAYATDDQGVTDLGAQALVDPVIQEICDAIRARIIATDGNFFGVTRQYLNGNRGPAVLDGVRTQETNLGNLTADANLFVAKQYDPETLVSIKNGGGIRASIGEIVVPPGAVEPVRVPPSANPLSGRPEGGISQNAIQSSLAFNNGLTLLTVTRAQLKALLEHGVAAAGAQGRFPQVSGVRFAFDETLPAGSRIVSASLFDEQSRTAIAPLVENGVIVGDPADTIRIVTLNFLASGGDGYPFPGGPGVDRVDLVVPGSTPAGVADFALDGSEQDALAEYLAARFPDETSAFAARDIPQGQDPRIQNLTFRSDTANFPPPAAAPITLAKIGNYSTGVFGKSAAEISAFDPASKRIFFVNADSGSVTMLNAADPANPILIGEIDIQAKFGSATIEASPNSVAIANGLVAVAVSLTETTPDGKDMPLCGLVAFYQTNGAFITDRMVGYGPDNLVFSPNGSRLVVANEGEPNSDYSFDPEGSVSVIEVKKLPCFISKHPRFGKRAPQFNWWLTVREADFRKFRTNQLLAAGVRIFGPGASSAQDIEPEYCAISKDGRTAYVTLQENNAIAVVDLNSAKVRSIQPLGRINHAVESAIDASDRDGAINIENWPVYGMFLPDSIATYQVKGETYLVTANEGDARDYDGFAEEARVSSLPLDPVAFPDAALLKNNAALGRLTVTNTLGDLDGDGDFDEIHVFGTRSFTIWKVEKKGGFTRVYDSGADFEKITASLLPADFNSTNDENATFDNRSDNKGPEPEGVAVGEVAGRMLAFIGLERIGGVMVYDISDPENPGFVQYINPRDFTVAEEDAGDLGAEGLEFIPAAKSPNGKPLLVLANEVSGNISIFEIAF
jgi:2',3'-cyclic-nucleotide 2'-phosphodiesterase (5'-nucleotidase family)